MPTIIVLNDGETYTNADGVCFVDITDSALVGNPDELEYRLDALMLSDGYEVPGLRITRVLDNNGDSRQDSPDIS